MIRPKQIIAVSCLVSLVGAVFMPAADAFRGSIGAISGQKKLEQGMGTGESDLAASPMLLEMAKLIGRTGLPPGFFLQNDGPLNEEQGVDLRTLLLYQAGLIKTPIRLITGRKAAPQPGEPAPTLILPAMPDPRLTAKGPITVDDKPKVAAAKTDKTKIAVANEEAKPATPAPLIKLDSAKLQVDGRLTRAEAPAEVKADVPLLAMALPRATTTPAITNSAFRLWTFRPDAALDEAQPADAEAAEYDGTFVVATLGAIKSITGRHFVVAPGKLLASNKGGELVFETGSASVSVDPNATAVVEVVQQPTGTIAKVYALETTETANVAVQLAGGKQDTVRLPAGEMLLVSDHPLTAAELREMNLIAAKKINANTTRASFSVKDFVSHELIAASQARIKDPEQLSAISALKKRVSGER